MVSVIDLTVPVTEDIPHSGLNPPAPHLWQTYSHGMTRSAFEPFEDEKLNPTGRPFSFKNETVVLSGHTATHIDAPSHVDPDSDVDVASIDLDRLYCECLLIDVADRVDSGGAIEVTDIEASLETDGISSENIPTGIFVRTGWSRYRESSPKKYLQKYPGLTSESAKWVLDKDVDVIGVDAPNVDRPDDPRQPAHVGFLRRGWPQSIPIVENLAALDAIPDPTFTVFIAPIPLVTASGAPARVVAFVE